MIQKRSILERWLWERGFLKGRFCEKNGISIHQIQSALKGEPPSAKTAHAIVKATNGEVDYNALYAPAGAHEPSLLKKLLSVSNNLSDNGENHDQQKSA